MKKIFLTSSPTGSLDGKRSTNGHMDEMNRFAARLRENWPDSARCLMITAFPDRIEDSEQMTDFFRHAMEISGLPCACFDLWDCRTEPAGPDGLTSYDVVVLGGGHVPTQNHFLRKLGVREAMENFDGIVIGISAGSMNSADWVYCQPEEDGEAFDPGFQRWIRGLGLTQTRILPHYQMVKDRWLDGMRLYEDITAADSMGNCFLLMVDGTYLYIEDGRETVCGEAYTMKDGVVEQICREGEEYCWL